MNDSQRHTHYRTGYSSKKKGMDTGTVLGIVLVLLALVALFIVMMVMQ